MIGPLAPNSVADDLDPRVDWIKTAGPRKLAAPTMPAGTTPTETIP